LSRDFDKLKACRTSKLTHYPRLRSVCRRRVNTQGLLSNLTMAALAVSATVTGCPSTTLLIIAHQSAQVGQRFFGAELCQGLNRKHAHRRIMIAKTRYQRFIRGPIADLAKGPGHFVVELAIG
jgi:hypothetical protein